MVTAALSKSAFAVQASGAASSLSLAVTGRAQPLLISPAAQKSGIDNGVPVSNIPGAEQSIGVDAASIGVESPTDGTYTIRMAGIHDEDYTIVISYTDTNGKSAFLSEHGFNHSNTTSFTFTLNSASADKIIMNHTPLPPTGLQADAVSSGGLKTRLTWTANTSPDVSGYNVYAKFDDEPYLAQIGTSATASFDTGDPWAENATIMPSIYAVSAKKADGTESFLSNMVENNDRDHDGLTDAQETELGTNISNPDSDGDGLNDGEEYIRGTNPLVADTDGDGYSDYAEILAGSDPLSAASRPNVPDVYAVTASNVAYETFVSGSFDLSAVISGNGGDVIGCEYCVAIDGTCDTEWAAGTLTGSGPNFTCAKTGIIGTEGQTLTLNMRATSANGTGTGTAITRTVDAVAPTTTDNALNAWTATSPVAVTLTPLDGTGSGVAAGYPKYCVDTTNTCMPNTSGTSLNVTCTAGSTCTQYVRYQSKDNVGNTETVKLTVAIRQDLKAPVDGSLTPTPGNGQVVLNWTAATDTGSGLKLSDTYRLVRNARTVPATPNIPAVQCTTGIQVYLGTGLTATDAGLTNGTTYDYRLCAYDNAGNISSGATAMATPGRAGKMARNIYPLLPEGWVVNAYTDGTGPYTVNLSVLKASDQQPVPFADIQGMTANPLLIVGDALVPDLTLVMDEIDRTAYILHNSGGQLVLSAVTNIRQKLTAPPPVLQATPTLINFGTITAGTTKNSTVTVTNTGGSPLHFTSITSPSAPFTRISDTCTGVAIAPSGICSIGIRFAPTAAMPYNSSFSISSDGGNATITLQGTGSTGGGSR